MKQRRITDYFALPRPNPTQTLSFLDLPLPVRARIYRHTDATNHFIDLNFAGLVVHPPQKTSDGVQHDQLARIKCVCYEYCFEINTPMRSLNGDATLDEHEVVTSDDEFFFGIERMCHAPKKRGGWIEGCGFDETAFNLLLSCKSIHKDLEPIIYAENTFRVCQGNPHGFERLRRMSDRAIASLKTLTIRLTLPHAYNKADVSWFSQLDRLRTIGTSGPCDEMMMTDWKDVVSRFSKLLESGRLELGVIFRSGSENIVTTLAPLLDLPPLKNFTVFPINPSLSPASGRREFRVSERL